MRAAPPTFGFGYLIGGIGLAFLLVLGAVVRDSNSRAVYDSMAELERTHELVHALDTVLTSAIDAETGARGYVVTGRENYLEPYADANASLDSELAGLDELLRDDHDNLRAMATLRARLTTLRQQLAAIVKAARTRGGEAGAVAVDTGQSKAAMDAVRAHADALELEVADELWPLPKYQEMLYIK